MQADHSHFSYSRQNVLSLPETPLPFYAYGTGITSAIKNQILVKGANLNQYVGVIWIISGYFEMMDSDRKIVVGKDHTFYHLSNERTWMRCISETASFRWISFDGPFADAFMLSFKYPRHQDGEKVPSELIERLEAIISDENPLQVKLKSALVMEILAHIGNNGTGSSTNQKTVDLALGLIRDNLSNPELNLDFLCARTKASRTNLTRMFKKRVKFAPGRYILNQKLTRALALLSGTNLSIAKTAALCGYRDPITFSRFIKRATGLGPRNYRKQSVPPSEK